MLWLCVLNHNSNIVLADILGKCQDVVKRLMRKTICFSKLGMMYDPAMGLLINKLEFGVGIHDEV
jgi:IS1 family transposase